MSYYSCSIGSYTFSVYPSIQVETDEIVRQNVTPNRLVARNYRWLVRGRITASTPAATATALLAFMTAAVNPASGTIPTTFKILDAGAVVVAQVGNVGASSEEWEDLRVTSFVLLPNDGSLVADTEFDFEVSARRSFPDANGICELFQEYRDEPDEFGNTIRNLTTTEIRLAKTSVNTIAGTSAITSQLKIACPVGWHRTKGDATRGFTIRYLDYPLLHRASCESEVTKGAAGGTSPPAGANSATTSERYEEDPEKGVRRYFYEDESVGSVDGLTWIRDLQSAHGDVTGGEEARVEEKTYRGKWQRLEALVTPTVGKVTRTKRTFQATGGQREGGSILMSAPHLPLVTRGPWTPTRLVETVLVYALGATGYADIPLPDPLPGPWLLVEPTLSPEPSVEEDSRYPSQRLWSRGAVREYLWGGAADDPRADANYIAALFADSSVTL